MNRSLEKALSYLTGNDNIDTITIDDLQKLVAENPYFPVSQFLLAKKTSSENEGAGLLQVQKAALYFSNPFWLHYQLSGIGNQETITTAKIITEDNRIEDIASTTEQTEPSTYFASTEAIEEIGQDENLTKTTEPVSNEENNTVEDIEGNAEIDSKETAEPEITQAEEEMAAVTRDTDEEAENFINNLDTKTEIAEPVGVSLPENLSPTAETEVVELEEEMAGTTQTTDETTEHFLQDVSHEQNDGQLQDDEHDKMFQNIKAMLDASTEEADADTRDAIIPIDPYYTIDYFASQGIKLDLDQNPKDQLGQNLKKFTQWLRHMKKLGPEDATEVINRTETEADIQQIADSSNTVREVVTEAMATVLEKQGKKDKAIELYKKLSFLNPDKSTYFAGKIKKLKGI